MSTILKQEQKTNKKSNKKIGKKNKIALMAGNHPVFFSPLQKGTEMINDNFHRWVLR